MAESIGGPLKTVNNNYPCAHLDADAMKNNYHVVLAYYVTCIAEKASERKANDVYCRAPRCEATNRIHACLECAFFGCFELCKGAEEIGGIRVSPMKGHFVKYHHKFAINIGHGGLFCFVCDDYVYNETFESIITEYKLEARSTNKDYRSYLPWMPNKKEIDMLKGKIKVIKDRERPGVKGIVNIGSSCYFNAVIQPFLHNPFLRDFFLSDKHKCFNKKWEPCLMCAMFVMFQEFYSGVTLPYVPWSFFLVLEKFCQISPGKDQEDAYELLTELLAGLCSCKKTNKTDNCNCIIGQIFFGIIQKERTCSVCEQLSYFPDEPFLSILLDKENNKTLEEILNRKFLTKEPLSGYRCQNCKEIETTFYRETIKKLPAVICFRMNIFEFVEGPRKKGLVLKKKKTRIEFKDYIDMSAYLNTECNIQEVSNESIVSKTSDAIVTRYYLFAVLFHKSDEHKRRRNIDNGGHYCVHIKHNCKWYECDDDEVYNRSWKEVLESEPYLLYYCQQL